MLAVHAASVMMGRLFDEHGQCNTPSRPLVVDVAMRRPAPRAQWLISVGLPQSLAHVNVLVDREDIDACDHDLDGTGVPLLAMGLLYSDETQWVLGDDGRLLYNTENKPVRRAPIAVRSTFEGARLIKDEDDTYRIRVDCAQLLPFYLEFPVLWMD